MPEQEAELTDAGCESERRTWLDRRASRPKAERRRQRRAAPEFEQTQGASYEQLKAERDQLLDRLARTAGGV